MSSVPPEPADEVRSPDAGSPPAAAASATSSRLRIGGDWNGVSPKYLGVEIVSSVLGLVVLCGITVPFILLGTWFGWPALGLAFVIGVVVVALAPRRVRSIGYQLRADDLVFTRGIMFHRVVAVPYGRMQLIDITRGPVSRALGLADLKFVTAAAATGVSIPGLVDDEATRLRDELVSLAESRRVGL